MAARKHALVIALILGGLAGCATETGNGDSTSTSGASASTSGASASSGSTSAAATSGSSGTTTGSSGTSGDGGYVCVEAGVSPESNCGEGCQCCDNQCVCTPGSGCPDAGP